MEINVDSVSFAYNSTPVLNNISFTVQKGEFIGIVGPNGAGKTTILKLIQKLLKPKSGKIQIRERSLKGMKLEDIAKTIGYIPQTELTQFPTSVFNTILMGRKPHFSWGPTENDLEIVSSIILNLGLKDLSLRNINEMSGGQRQKVIIGRVFAQDPDILLLDEPTANLDLHHQLEILDLLKDLSKRGKTVVMAIHDLNLALKYCDKFIMVHDHQIYACGGREIFTQAIIKKVFQVKVSIFHDDNGGIFLIPIQNSKAKKNVHHELVNAAPKGSTNKQGEMDAVN
ncbi:MAG: ABC transporter ATP-binding protein [Candidatus Lokiarchaeota archaeon]|nr:ABC transporter ATP-binding protein [Candidatus Lokiarchaeota archaeon]